MPEVTLGRLPRRVDSPGGRGLLALTLAVTISTPAPGDVPAGAPDSTTFYSTAAPPVDYPGPAPVRLVLARAEEAPAENVGDKVVAVPEPATASPALDEPPPRIASTTPVSTITPSTSASAAAPEASPKPKLAADPIVQAKRLAAESKQKFAQVKDYTCTFYKRERIDGRMTPQYVMQMKSRTHPLSVYFKFVRPNAGREAIYIAGRHNGKVMVHDVGIGKLLAGTLSLDPRSSRAMEDNRHPITEAGMGHMIQEINERWQSEMRQGETLVTIHESTRVGNRVCTMVESVHPRRGPAYLFHKVKVYFDHEHGLPIRFEAYDWPRRAGAAPELAEEYTYANLRLNAGLREGDFDPANAQYSFGRF